MATVRARTPLRLQALDRAPFLAAATGAPDGTVPEPGLEQPALDELAAVGRRVSVEAGEDVVRQGEPGDCFYVVLEGTAAVYSGERLVRTLVPGDHFGEIALLHRTPRTATVRGVTDLRLFSLDREALLGISPGALAAARLV